MRRERRCGGSVRCRRRLFSGSVDGRLDEVDVFGNLGSGVAPASWTSKTCRCGSLNVVS